MTGRIHSACSVDHGVQHVKICHSRILYGRIFLAGSFHPDGALCDHDVSAHDIQLHTSAGPYPEESIRTAFHQFFKRDRCGRSPDTGTSHGYLYAVQRSRICHILSVVSNQYRIVEIFCYLRTAFRVARQDDITSDFAFGNLDMILPVRIFRIIHINPLLYLNCP